MAIYLNFQSRRRRVLVSAVLMVLALGAITVSTALARSPQVTTGSVRTASTAAANEHTIRLTVVETHSATFFTGPGGSPQPGDRLVIQQDAFYDAKQQKPAGTVFIECTFTWSDPAACTANVLLTNRGQLLLSALSIFGPSITVAILGGTGEFTDVGGTAELIQVSPTVGTDILHIQA